MTLETIVTGASVVCGIGAFFALAILNAIEGRRHRLENLVVGAFVASAIPTGLILLACAFDPSLLQRMSGLNVHIAIAGLVLLYVSLKCLVGEWRERWWDR